MTEFRDMVERCNKMNVSIYVDAIINHMAAGEGLGSGGSYFNSFIKSYPSVPYKSDNFNDKLCKSPSGNIENYYDIDQVRNCKLYGMPDLSTGQEYGKFYFLFFVSKRINSFFY